MAELRTSETAQLNDDLKVKLPKKMSTKQRRPVALPPYSFHEVSVSGMCGNFTSARL